MDKQDIRDLLKDFVNNDAGNRVSGELALRPDLEGLKLLEPPLVGFGESGDPAFKTLKEPEVVGSHFMLPQEWLEGAKTVISLFFPFTAEVKASNGADMNWPSDEWLHARIEGQDFLFQACRHVQGFLEARGFSCLIPSLDRRFTSNISGAREKSPAGGKNRRLYYTSNWSERHVAYVCGLGTFGLSRGLITARGMAGRFGSILTSAPFEGDPRPYSRYDEYCTRCGACARNCPAAAISLTEGKRHPPCAAFVDSTMEKHQPRYGCGKCQVRVPCENGIPPARRPIALRS
ncbi:MAG: 4Fe-4S binding protein [Treponema sp.]|jgi:epoxyqueuosine reductase QueG|nr:4Fe-4S binding protein [Treponema sp.]